MRDLESEPLFAGIKSFSERMHSMRNHLAAAQNWQYKYSKQRWFLDAVEIYCEAVTDCGAYLEQANPNSRGLRAFQNYLARVCRIRPFQNALPGNERSEIRFVGHPLLRAHQRWQRYSAPLRFRN